MWETNGTKKVAKRTKQIYDVIIIGGCVTGVTTALMLQKSGLNVVLLEYSEIGFLTSGCYTTHMNTYFDALNNDIVSNLTAEELDLYSAGGLEAKALIINNITAYNLKCELEKVNGYIFSNQEDQQAKLDDIVASSHRVGIGAAFVDTPPFKLPSTKAAIFNNQHTINAVSYINGLVKEFQKAGGLLIERCRVLKIEMGPIHHILTSRGRLNGKRIMYTPQTSRILNLSPYKFTPYIHYTVSAKLISDADPISISYDLENPSHRFIASRNKDMDFMVIRGEDHRVVKGKVRAEYFEKLTKLLTQNFKVEMILAKWSYVYYKSEYQLPIIEKMNTEHGNIFISAGYNPDGMIVATLGAKIISDMILQHPNQYSQLFIFGKQDKILGTDKKRGYLLNNLMGL